MDYYQKIDQLRVDRGWTFYRLSQESGLTQQTFTQWQNRKSTPTLAAIKAVCNAFGISMAQFFAENDEVVTKGSDFVSNWNRLTAAQQHSIELVVNNYLKLNN